jgi:kinesin family protein 1
MLPDRQLSLPIKPNRVDGEDRLHVPYIEEVRVSPVVSRKGYLNFLEEKHSGWSSTRGIQMAKENHRNILA